MRRICVSKETNSHNRIVVCPKMSQRTKASKGGPRGSPIYDTNKGFNVVTDNLGLRAYERNEDVDTENPIIQRVQAGPDPGVTEMKTQQDVIKKIKEIKNSWGESKNSELYHRVWTKSESEEVKRPVIGNITHDFSLLQFNILAEGLSIPSENIKFPFSFPEKNTKEDLCRLNFPGMETVLDFEQRKWRLLEVILGVGYAAPGTEEMKHQNQNYNGEDIHLSDVVLVQEMDRYYGFFAPLLDIFGYEGRFVPKFRSPCIELGFYSCGCAMFWRKDKFQFKDIHTWSYGLGNSQVGMAVTLKHKAAQRKIVFVNTHLKAGEEHASKYGQKLPLLDGIGYAIKKSGEADIPVVLGADLNADHDSMLLRSLLAEDSNPQLTSVYNITPLPENYFTTWKVQRKKEKRRTIDYILYNRASAKGIKCTHVLQPPNEQDIEPHKLPGYRYPSDHISIVANFALESKS